MKRTLIIIGIITAVISSCQKDDVFALWRDKSKEIIKGDATTFVTMMQYNIWGANSPWSSERFDKIASVINGQKADFVALNEVDSMTRRNPYHMAKELAERTGMHYAYAKARGAGASGQIGNGSYGDAVLSKYPILEIRRFIMKPDPNHTEDGKEDRSVCAIRVEINGKKLWVACTHLDHRNLELSRIYQARNLKGIVDQFDGPLILAGDLNAKPDSQTMGIIFEYMKPQYPSTSKEYYTFPSCYNGEDPWKLIDYILLRKEETELDCVSFRVVNSPASDHCAVVASFRMRD